MEPERIIADEAVSYAIRDIYPVTEGHTLIIPKRHVASFRNLSEKEWQSIYYLARQLSDELRKEDSTISGFNFGINDGEWAGQTIFHVHVHLIPRREGDVPNPRGGVRHVIPCKGSYPSE